MGRKTLAGSKDAEGNHRRVWLTRRGVLAVKNAMLADGGLDRFETGARFLTRLSKRVQRPSVQQRIALQCRELSNSRDRQIELRIQLRAIKNLAFGGSLNFDKPP